ncbi:division/cell wall cluster transcriptional repressor MraZ [Citreimonas sp.]|uniref:division/cell wall cluster transcriptional repressor MraZ n=1 Tax=Citreimonas sp. TaxID=3036715 RepID=UPI0035C84AE7
MGRRLKFRGEGTHKVDGKGRVSIPAGFRRVLEAGDPDWVEGKCPNFVIVYGDHRRKYLQCYTVEAIEEVDEQIASMPRGSQKRRVLEKLFSGQSVQSSVDESGRIVLPVKLRGKIDLSSEAYFIASGDTFEIWNPATYEAEEQARTEAFLDDLPDDFDPLMLLDPSVEV